MATNEMLQEIRDHLGDLPERLARVLGKSPAQRDPSGKVVGQDSPGPRFGASEVKIPSKWQASERFAHSLGKVLPGFGLVTRAMSAGRELADSWGNLRSAFGPRSAPEAGRFTPQPSIPKAIGGSMSPPLPVKPTQPGSGTSLPLPTASASTAAIQSPGAKFFQELINEMKLLREEMRRVREATRQTEPDQSDDSERVPSPSMEKQTATAREPWNRILPLSTQHPDRTFSKSTGPFRPEKDVPSHNDSGNGAMEKGMSAAKGYI